MLVENNKAPIGAETPTGATIHAAEAERTRNPIIGFCCVDLKRSTYDVPQLPFGNGKGRLLRKEPGSALEVPAMRQALR